MMEQLHKPKPRFTSEILNNFPELKSWLEEISRFNKFKDFIFISDYKKGEIRIEIFTKKNRYFIRAIPTIKDRDGYLGCTVKTRKPRAGEDWTRGRDLPDGSYSKETWQKIKDDILAFELVKTVRISEDK